MRWKFSRNADSMYTCLWCFHIKTGTLLLGVFSLLLQVATLVMILVAFLRPDVVPTWVSTFIAPSVNGNAVRMHERMWNTRGGGMMSDSERNAMMGDSHILDRDYMKNLMRENGVKDGHGMDDMMVDEDLVGGQDMRKVMAEAGMLDSESMKKMMKDNGMIRGRGMGEMMEDGEMMTGQDMKKAMADAGTLDAESMQKMMEDNGMIRGSRMDEMMGDQGMKKAVAEPGMMDTPVMKKMMKDNGMTEYENEMNNMMNLNPDMAQKHAEIDGRLSDHSRGASDSATQMTIQKSTELDSDDKFLLFVMLVGCIAASVMLIHGVIKGRPGYLMPYMGLQVFDFCISSLIVFTCFSYAPSIKQWIAAQPDSLPMKSCLMSINTDRLMLGLILTSVLILVVKAYLMAVVWACYKYLTQSQQEAVRGRRRSTDDDMTNPEDAELLLPPKYEDIVSAPDSQPEAVPAPPPYAAA